MQYNPAMLAPARPPALPATLLLGLTSALNALLATQPAARARLADHAGKTLRLAVPGVDLDLGLDDTGIFAPGAEGAEPDLILTPEPAALPLWLARGTLGELFRIRGDGLFAADLSGALADFDWVLALRPVLGDIAASRVDAFLRGLGPWRDRTLEAAGRNLAEYAVYEQPILADPLAVSDFVAQVDALREAADRLDARLKLLETRRPA